MFFRVSVLLLMLVVASPARAQSDARVAGRVTDETGGGLPGVTVELKADAGGAAITVTAASGDYAFDHVAPGRYHVAFTLINFASVTRRGVIVQSGISRVDAVLHLALNAEVTVTGTRTFANL